MWRVQTNPRIPGKSTLLSRTLKQQQPESKTPNYQRNEFSKQWPQVQHQHSDQVTQEKTEELEKGRKGEREKKEKGREGEEEGDQEVKKDVMGWTVVTRSKKQRKRTIQIFVKVDGSKV